MKTLIIAAALCFTASAATLKVCTSGCPFPTVQAAASASNPGDTIVLQAGQDLGGLTMPGGWHNITIKSSAIDTYPRGYRVQRGGCPAGATVIEPLNPGSQYTCSSGATVLARISGGGVALGDSSLWLTPQGGTVNTGASGAVTWVSGPVFTSAMVGNTLTIAGQFYPVLSFTDSTHLTVGVGSFYTGAAGQTAPTYPPAGGGVPFFYQSATTLVNNPGGGPAPHGLVVGNKIVATGVRYSAYYCYSATYPSGYPPAPYNTASDTSCTTTASNSTSPPQRNGFISVRMSSGLGNGDVVYFLGRTLPSPLQLNTPYYVVNFTAGGPYVGNTPSTTLADQFQVSLTSGGSPVAIPMFNPSGQDFVIEYDPTPIRSGTTLYVLSTPSPSTLTVGLTSSGPAISVTQPSWSYNGSSRGVGFTTNTVNPVHDITFDGVEVAPGTGSGNYSDCPGGSCVYYPFYVSGSIGYHSNAGEHYNINVWRSWIHGADDQLDFPYAVANIAGNNIDIEWSVIENGWSTGNDTQCIGVLSTGYVNINNNDIKGCTENIMSGGNTPWFGFGQNTNGINVTDNYIWKPLKAYVGITVTYVSPSTFTLLPFTATRTGTDDCSTNYVGTPVTGIANITLGSASVSVSGVSGTISPGMSATNAFGSAAAAIPLGAIVTAVSVSGGSGTITISLAATANETGEALTFFNPPILSKQCFWNEAQETPNTSTSPANPVVARYQWDDTAANSTFTVTSSGNGQVGLIYGLGGAIHLDYNFSGTVNCPTGTVVTVTCTFVTSPFFPTTSTRIGIACIGGNTTYDCPVNGTINAFDAGTFYLQNRSVWSKNLIESKYGDNWLIEGNVLHRSFNCDNGTFCQGPGIQMDIAGNGSDPGAAVNWSVSSSYSIMRHNLMRMMAYGINTVGNTFAVNIDGAGLTYEWAGFGLGINNVIQNNVAQDIGSYEYTCCNNGQFAMITLGSNSTTIDHNTSLDTRLGVATGASLTGLAVTSNVITNYRSACPQDQITSCGNPATTSEIGVQNQPGTVPYPQFNCFASSGLFSAAGWVPCNSNGVTDVTSTMAANLWPNRPGFFYQTALGSFYPTSTYLVPWTGSGGASQQPANIFTTWNERSNSAPPDGVIYRQGNYHLLSGVTSAYPANDSRVIGADIDEVNSFVGGIPSPGIVGQANGLTGSDVENGWPQFYRRVSRNINIGSTSAVLTYLSDGMPCTIELWPNTSYSGTPTVNISDSGAAIIDGVITLPLTGLSAGTFYQGKRLCGNFGAATEADIISFTTLAATPTLTYQFAPPSGTSTCTVEYGATLALGSTTAPVSVSGGICSLTVPSTTYWRNDYKAGGGNVLL